MNKIKAVFLGLSLMMLMSFTEKGATIEDCSILNEGAFKYGDIEEEIRVEIKGNNHTEYHDGGKYMIKSKLEWVNDCEYNMIMTKITIPNFPYRKGDVMNVKVDKIMGNVIYYTSTVKGNSWN